MSMYRARRNQKRWQRRWPWRHLIQPRVDERFCPECQMPYHEGPVPQPVLRIFQGNVVVMIFPSGSHRSDEFALRLGRWKAGGKQFYCSEFVPVTDLPEIAVAIERATVEVERLQREARKRRQR